jgi:hypothetical protein
MTRHLTLVRGVAPAPVPAEARALETAATLLERRAALRHRVEISDDLARDIARSLRELALLKRRPAHG